MPVAFAMAFSGGLGLYLTGGLPILLGVLQTTPLSAVTSYELITIPMFLLMADLVLLSGVADDLFKTAAAWVGRIPGGLGMATALAGAGFGSICGTSTASAATLSSTSLPAMIRQGYEPRMAAGVVAISGTLAMLLPTSVALVIFGLLAEVNIGKLLISGIIPAIFVTIDHHGHDLYPGLAGSVARADHRAGAVVGAVRPALAGQPDGGRCSRS